jgi:hypothetical protein
MFFITKAELNFKKLKLNFIGAEDFKWLINYKYLYNNKTLI